MIFKLRDLENNLFSYTLVNEAAWEWYGSTDLNSCCLAENRIVKGELPKGYEHDGKK